MKNFGESFFHNRSDSIHVPGNQFHSLLMKKYILPSNENACQYENHKTKRMDHLLYFWRYFKSRIDHVNYLIKNNEKTSTPIEGRKWEEIKDSETERNHSCKYDYASELDTIVSKSNKDSTNSDRTTYTSCCFLFLFSRSCIRKTRTNNRSKSTE